MAPAKTTTLEAATARHVLQRLARLERGQNHLLSGGYNQSFPLNPITTKWGRTTTTSEYPTYPTAGLVVACELGKYEPSPEYPSTSTTRTFTPYYPAETLYATAWDSPLPFQGEVVPLTWFGGRWWYTHPRERKAKVDSTINANSYGDVSVYQNGVDVGTVRAYFNWMENGIASIATDAEILIRWFDDEQKWVIVAAECSA